MRRSERKPKVNARFHPYLDPEQVPEDDTPPPAKGDYELVTRTNYTVVYDIKKGGRVTILDLLPETVCRNEITYARRLGRRLEIDTFGKFSAYSGTGLATHFRQDGNIITLGGTFIKGDGGIAYTGGIIIACRTTLQVFNADVIGSNNILYGEKIRCYGTKNNVYGPGSVALGFGNIVSDVMPASHKLTSMGAKTALDMLA
jgi:hypothetical protein